MNGDTWVGIVALVVAAIVLAGAVAVENAMLTMRRPRVKAIAAKGVPRAPTLESYMEDRRRLLSTMALARNVAVVLLITITTFFMLREAGHTWRALAATMGGTFLLLVVLQAGVRRLVAENAERWGLRLVPTITILRFFFGLPSRSLDWVAGALLGNPDGKEPPFDAAHEDPNLLRLVEMSEVNGEAGAEELTMIRRISNMVDKAVREIMVPRIDMIAVETAANVDDVISMAVEKGFSRIPLYEETVDNIVGVVYAKDLLPYLANGIQGETLKEIARPPYFIPEGKHVDELLTELRQNRVHMAIVVDEYGGTAGLVTIEDVLEEIVGEIQDEYDREEVTIERVTESEAIIDARVSLDEVNELFSLEIEGDDYDTLGGFVYQQLGRMPAAGDEVAAGGLTLRVLSVLGRRIKKVRVTKSVRDGHGAGP